MPGVGKVMDLLVLKFDESQFVVWFYSCLLNKYYKRWTCSTDVRT